MRTDPYSRLARKLDELPNEFPVTDSGLRLLAKLFAEDEAEVASHMRASLEPPSVIARRAGLGDDEAGDLLAEMARKGLVRSARAGDDRAYGLMPFAVGVYEEALPCSQS